MGPMTIYRRLLPQCRTIDEVVEKYKAARGGDMAIEQNSSESKKKITLNITTPRGLKYVEQADMLIMRCVDGDLGVLPGHAPVSAVLGDGILRIFNNGGEQKLAVFGGIVGINDTTVNMFTTIAQRPEEIDRERAEVDFQKS